MNEEMIKALKESNYKLESQKYNILEKKSEAKQSIGEKEFIDALLTNCARHLKDVYKQKDYIKDGDNPQFLNVFTITRVLSVALAFGNESLILHKLLNKINEL